MREREEANRTREAGHLDEIQGVVANTLDLFPNGAACRVFTFTLVRCIVWLGLWVRVRRSMSYREIQDKGNDEGNANNPPDCLKSRRFCLGSELLFNEVVVVEVVFR